MKKLQASIKINAPKEKVWHTMLDNQTYRQWTEVFHPGSYYKGNWEKDSKMLFLGPNPETGEEGGMIAKVVENKPYEYISLEHVGIINNGVEDTTSDEVAKWTPAFENYTFTEENGVTTVSIEMDVLEEHMEMFNQMWPEALEKLKEIAEKGSEG